MAGGSIRAFLNYFGIPITATALSELIANTGKQHKEENFEADDPACQPEDEEFGSAASYKFD